IILVLRISCDSVAYIAINCALFFFSSRRRHTRSNRDWSSDVCSSDLRALRARLAGGDARAIYEAELLRGELPPANLGQIALREIGEQVEQLMGQLAVGPADPARSVDIDEIGRASRRDRVGKSRVAG